LSVLCAQSKYVAVAAEEEKMVRTALHWLGTLGMVLVCAMLPPGFAQETGPNAALANEVMVVPLAGV
jgi:hypothetical protein